ncbi:hypothetical protein AB0P17_17120 [Streptomyces sp. NPDC088124]|uniref:hypothetical protein n=1 Tax=Streptomyces sp. NPDC088124 TaxID=3154654 RepID=UPI00341FEC5C
MRNSIGSAVLLGTLALLTGCGIFAGDTRSCTLMDAPAGIRIDVHPELSNRVADATLAVCWDGTCQKRTLEVRKTSPEEPAAPGNPVMTTESATTAEGPAPTSAQTPELSFWPGFVNIRDLPGEPVDVTLEFKDQRGATVLDRQIDTTPQPTYPNGRACSPGGHQARLTVTEKGSLIPR